MNKFLDSWVAAEHEELSDRFSAEYPEKKEKLIDDEYSGVTACNGVLSLWTDGTVNYWTDTPDNRKQLTEAYAVWKTTWPKED